jgi:hypothetical protein
MYYTVLRSLFDCLGYLVIMESLIDLQDLQTVQKAHIPVRKINLRHNTCAKCSATLVLHQIFASPCEKWRQTVVDSLVALGYLD